MAVLYIPLDDLRSMVQGGLIQPGQDGAMHPGPNWALRLIQQLKLARQTAVDTALRYREVVRNPQGVQGFLHPQTLEDTLVSAIRSEREQILHQLANEQEE